MHIATAASPSLRGTRSQQGLAPSPVGWQTSVAITALVAGAKHACSVDSSNNILCWGDDSSGQLGPSGPTVAPDASAVGISVPGGALLIAAGGSSTCVASNGQITCWGANEHAQLGHSPSTDPYQSCPGNGGPCNPIPTPTAGLGPVAALAMGPVASCALLKDGTVWCWGSASFTGSGNAAPDASTLQPTPIQVHGLPPP